MNFNLRKASVNDKVIWKRYDPHLSEREFESKIAARQCLIIEHVGKAVGVMRYNLFWDSIPFLNHIFIDEKYQGAGIGRFAMETWESEMRRAGYDIVMTSTQVDESAQHFYRKIGYTDCGCLISELLEQPMEMFMIKKI